MVNWHQDFFQAYRFALPDQLNERSEIPDDLYSAMGEALRGVPDEIDFVFAVEHGGDQGFLLVQDDNAWFVRFEPPNVAVADFLGDLRGGQYTERVTAALKDHEIEMIFEHEQLGDKGIKAKLKKPYPQPGLYPSHETDFLVERGDKLREKFNRWSSPHGAVQ